MNELSNTKLFALFSEPSQVTNEEMQNAYGNFVKNVEKISSENDYTAIFRNLSKTRIELSTLEYLNRYEQGEKRPKIRLFSKGFRLC
ncbi:MAG: hypothetical protein LBJ58_02595 [Tannerellaceae bacterium]|jgi:hypothetical protein|nr:hypothetical protein [Tannerellaceae bacterium]